MSELRSKEKDIAIVAREMLLRQRADEQRVVIEDGAVWLEAIWRMHKRLEAYERAIAWLPEIDPRPAKVIADEQDAHLRKVAPFVFETAPAEGAA